MAVERQAVAMGWEGRGEDLAPADSVRPVDTGVAVEAKGRRAAGLAVMATQAGAEGLTEALMAAAARTRPAVPAGGAVGEGVRGVATRRP